MTDPRKYGTADRSLLEIKRAANHQRNARREYLTSLPADLGAFLAQCPFVQSPELDAFSGLFYIQPNRSSHPAHQAADYTYRQFGWRHKVLQAAQTLKFKPFQEPAYFWSGRRSRNSYIADPLYCVPFHWVINNLPVLYSHSVGVVTQDHSAGLILDESCGYVQDDYNPEETVYELASWGRSEH